MDQRLWVAIIWVVAIGSTVAATYEIWALVTGHITISRALRTLAEDRYHPVYWFGGIVTALVFIIALFGTHLPGLIRTALLVWLLVFAHIFWVLC